MSSLSRSSPTITRMRAIAARNGDGGGGDVVVIGSANQDLTTYTRRIPHMGETVLGEAFTMGFGGKGANQANSAASCCGSSSTSSSNGPRVSVVCRVGPDLMGQALLDNFARRGVHYIDTSTVESCTKISTTGSSSSTGVASILVDMETGDNQIVVTPGANLDLEPRHVRHALESVLTDQPSVEESVVAKAAAVAAVVLVSLEIRHDTAWEALATAKAKGATTILNPAPTPTHIESFPWLLIDILIPNQSELQALYDMVVCVGGNKPKETASVDEVVMARTLLDQGIARAVIVTLGARGALIVERDCDGPTYVSAPDNLPGAVNVPVVDTVGAGDAFCGALSTYLAAAAATHGSSSITDSTNSLAEAVALACGYASLSVRRKGTDYPLWHQLPEVLRVVGVHHAAEPIHHIQLPKRKITFVTGNMNKLLEVRRILAQDESAFPFQIVNQAIDLPELQGDVMDIAKEKCRQAVADVQGPCFTEDTSLCFDALHGMPGPYIKWFLQSCGHDGLNQMLAGFNDKSAFAQTVIAYSDGTTNADGEYDILVFEGRTNGTIVPPRGPLDFGWDPIFAPNEAQGNVTYAEMSKDEKNAISHRGRAFAKLREYLLLSIKAD